MKNVGFVGGSFIFELGPRSDVVAFFKCVNDYVVNKQKDVDYTLLTDRLYRRYLKFDELDESLLLMMNVKKLMSEVQSKDVDWVVMGKDSACTSLDVSQETLADVFVKYFYGLNQCIDSAKIFFKSWNVYQPIKIVISDMPEYMEDKNRSLDQYSNLQGAPFWFR